MALVKVESITLLRHEGPHSECGKKKVFGSFAEANGQIAVWRHSSPEAGQGYDKCSVKVRWEDGEAFGFRYDSDRQDTRSLNRAMEQMWLTTSGQHCPSKWTDEQYQAFLNRQDATARDNAENFLMHYDLELGPQAQET